MGGPVQGNHGVIVEWTEPAAGPRGRGHHGGELGKQRPRPTRVRALVITTRGLMAALNNPDPSRPPDPPWAERARSAHANAIENLAVFAPLVLMCAMTGASGPATVFSAKLYLGARLVHYVVYAAGIPVVRTIAFLAGFAATLTFAVALLGHAS